MTGSQLSPVVLHIGCEKTGTKSIQTWLRDHEEMLATYGLRFPRGWLRLNCHQEFPLCLMRLDRMCGPREAGEEWRSLTWRRDVLVQIVEDLEAHRGMRTVYSSENLDLLRFDDEFRSLRRLVGDAEIVVYLRERQQWFAALRKQYLHKNTQPVPLSADPEAYNYLGDDSWRLDYTEVLAGWRRWFSTVRVIDYDMATAVNGSVIPSFLGCLGWPGLDIDKYYLNQRADDTPRLAGNRLSGLAFGQTPVLEAAGTIQHGLVRSQHGSH